MSGHCVLLQDGVFRMYDKRMSNGQKTDLLSVFMYFILIVSVIVVGVCLYLLVPKLLEYQESDDVFQRMSEMNVIAYNPIMNDATIDATVDVRDAVQIDWDSFANTEIVAWFQMDDISYPIMQHDDNSYYLDHLPDGTYNRGGSLFLLSNNSLLFTDQSSFVYGHNMTNGSMFGKLKNYTKNEFKDHSFSIYLPDGTRHVYQFFSVASVSHDSRAYTWAFGSDKSYLEWQKWMLEQSLIDTSCEISEDAKYVTLSTCNGYSGTKRRLVICGQEIRVDKLQRPASWYDSYVESYQQKNDEKVRIADEIYAKLQEMQQLNADELYKLQGY